MFTITKHANDMTSLYMTDTCWPSLHVTKISHTQMQNVNMPLRRTTAQPPLYLLFYKSY